jgi:hypothetical protein
MVAAGLVDDPRRQFALESALLEPMLDRDGGFGAPRRPIRHDLGGGPHHALDIGADQDRA